MPNDSNEFRILSQTDLFSICRILSKDKKKIIITTHARLRMNQRDITETDILDILLFPQRMLEPEPRYNIKLNDHTYWIQGDSVNKSIVIAIDYQLMKIVVVSVIALKMRK